MSLFGAKKQTPPLKELLGRAKENFEKRVAGESSPVPSDVSSSHIGAQLNKITGPLTESGESVIPSESNQEEREFFGTAEYDRLKAEEKQDEFEYSLHKAKIADDLRRRENSQATSGVEYRQLSRDMDELRVYSDLTGKTGVTGITRFGRDDNSELSLPPITSYGGSEISFPSQTPRQSILSPLTSMNYSEGSLLGLPLSALPQDAFLTPRASAGMIAPRYIQSEENASQYVEREEGMEETRKVYTPIPGKFEISDSSDDAMTEVEWRDKSPYMTPTKMGKKRNKRKGVKKPEMPKRPISNMPQTPSRRQLEADWAWHAEEVTNENKEINLEAFIGEYFKNTNGLRDFMINKAKYDDSNSEWCGEQACHIAARQNHMDVAVGSTEKIAQNILTEVELEREYAGERAEKLDERLSTIEKRLAKIAPMNMAKMIENAMKDCMERMVEQVTDQVVGRLEKLTESQKREEIRRRKQVEGNPENLDRSDIECEPGATFSEEEDVNVAKVLERMEVEQQELEALKHAPVIPPGEKRKEFPRFAPSGQVTIAKRLAIAPAVLEQRKKEVKKLEVKEIPQGPKAGEKKKLEVKKPVQPAKNPDQTKKESWAQKVAAPPPSKEQPEQRQQQSPGQQQKKKGDGFVEVERQQKKEAMKPVFPGQNSMENRRVTFKRDNGLPLSQKKDLDILSEVNRALFDAKVPHFIRIQGVMKNTRGCHSTITTPGAPAEMLIRYREIVIQAARNLDSGIVDIETNELWERVKMHGVNFDRYLGKTMGGGLEKLRQKLQAENKGVVLPLAINWIGGPKDVQKKKVEGQTALTVVFAVKGSKMAEKVLKGGLRAAEVKYDVEKFMNAGPDSFCGVCSRWGHVEAKCGSLKMPACMLCVGRHLTQNHT